MSICILEAEIVLGVLYRKGGNPQKGWYFGFAPPYHLYGLLGTRLPIDLAQAMHSSRFRFLNEYLKKHANADTVPDIVLLVGHRKADLTAGKGDDPARLTPEIEGHPINIHVTEDKQELSIPLGTKLLHAVFYVLGNYFR